MSAIHLIMLVVVPPPAGFVCLNECFNWRTKRINQLHKNFQFQNKILKHSSTLQRSPVVVKVWRVPQLCPKCKAKQQKPQIDFGKTSPPKSDARLNSTGGALFEQICDLTRKEQKTNSHVLAASLLSSVRNLNCFPGVQPMLTSLCIEVMLIVRPTCDLILCKKQIYLQQYHWSRETSFYVVFCNKQRIVSFALLLLKWHYWFLELWQKIILTQRKTGCILISELIWVISGCLWA